MDYYDRIQKAVDYIEQNLENDINPVLLAKEAYFSVTHFYRIFQGMIGYSVKSYIQKRRLSQAAIELVKTDRRIIDIALAYRYNSQEVFTRAFCKAFGVTPGRYRLNKSSMILYKKADLYTKLLKNQQSGVIIEPKIVLDKAFKIIGMKEVVKPGSADIKKLWHTFMLHKYKCKHIVNQDAVLGLCEYMPNITDDSEFTYFAGMEVTHFGSMPEGMVKKIMPLSIYARFSHKGSLADLKKTYHFIYGVWLPQSGYALAELDTIELYDKRANKDAYGFDIYIPLQSTP